MTWKPNPGCDIPEVPLPPSVEDFLDGLAADVLTDAAKYLIPVSGEAVYIADKAADLAEQKAEMLAQIQERADLIKKYEKLISEFAAVPCPLPDVVDVQATKK